MNRIGILTAGGDTPALNATIAGAVTRANQLHIEIIGFIKGFSSLFNPRLPHVHLNPLYQPIPELDATRGGTLLGASRDYVDADDTVSIKAITERLHALKIDGIICVGGDGTLNGMQALSESLPAVLAPKTIDNDLGLNYSNEPDEWVRHYPTHQEPDNAPTAPPEPDAIEAAGYWYTRSATHHSFDLNQMVNYVTPGYATAVFVSASGVQRVRTTAESHRRIAIVEVMGRHSGYIALGAMYGQPDILLVPEHRLNLKALVERVKTIYDRQKHVVIVCGEGIIDEDGQELGAEFASTDPAGNKILSGASEALRSVLIKELGDQYFTSKRRNESARAAIFTRKLGHTQRGGRPIHFDRYYAAQLGGHAVDLLVQGRNNSIAVLNWSQRTGFELSEAYANQFRDRYRHIHARKMHPSFYDPVNLRPSALGIAYLEPIFTNAVGIEDVEALRYDLFTTDHLTTPYHSVNTDITKRIRYVAPPSSTDRPNPHGTPG